MKIQKKLLVKKLFLLGVLLAGISGCSNESEIIAEAPHKEMSSLAYSDKSHVVTKLSVDKKYKVSLYSNQFPLTTGKIHTWTLKVLTADNKPIENIKIYVHGGMPIHQHGFPTNPRVTKTSEQGLYLVNGVKFSMHGPWEMRFNIKESQQRDRVIFDIKV